MHFNAALRCFDFMRRFCLWLMTKFNLLLFSKPLSCILLTSNWTSSVFFWVCIVWCILRMCIFGQEKKWMLKVHSIRKHALEISIVSFISLNFLIYLQTWGSRRKYSYKYFYAIRIIDRKADIITLCKRAFSLFD